MSVSRVEKGPIVLGLALSLVLACSSAPTSTPDGGGALDGGVDAGMDGGVDDGGTTDAGLPTEDPCVHGLVHVGTVDASERPGLQLLEGIHCLQGSLLIQEPALTHVELPDLMVVTGEVLIHDNDWLHRLLLPNLRTVGEQMHVGSVPVDGALVENPRLMELDLGSLEEVGGSLHLVSNGDLAGELSLPALRAVGGDLVIERSEELTSLVLPGLETVGGAADISILFGLRQFEAPILREITGDLTFFGLRALQRLRMPALETVGGELEIGGSAAYSFGELPALVELDLTGLQRVGGALVFKDLPALGEINLPALDTVEGELHLDLSTSGPNQIAAPSLRVVGGNITLWYGENLTSLELPSLETVGNRLLIGINRGRLESLAFPSLRTITGGLTLVTLDSLRSLSLPALEEVGFVDLERLPSLESADLTALRTVHGDFSAGPAVSLRADDLVALETVGGELALVLGSSQSELVLPSLTTLGERAYLGVAGGISTIRLPALQQAGGDLTLSGVVAARPPELQVVHLPALRELAGNFRVYNEALIELRLPALETVSGYLYLDFAELTVLEAGLLTTAGAIQMDGALAITALSLPSLTALSGFLRLSDNASLATVELPLLGSIGGGLQARWNRQAPECIFQALAASCGPAWVDIGGNRTDCTCTSAGGSVTATCP